MEARAVDAGRGWAWIVDGFELFRKNPVIWIALSVVLIIINIVLMLVPLIGHLLVSLLLPVFVAGLMLGWRAQELGEEIEIGHLFLGFKKNTNRLVSVGGVFLVGNFIIIGIMVVIGGAPVIAVFKEGADVNSLMGAAAGLVLAGLVGLALSVPLFMVIWFAPLLVVFTNAPVVKSLQLSFAACLKNIIPFLIYGIAVLVLAFVASIPLALGWLVLAPVLLASIYTSYKDIFPDGLPAG